MIIRPIQASDSELSQFQSILLSTDGTVTDLIRHFTGEDIRVTKLLQEIIDSDKPQALELSGKQDLLHRKILLSGKNQHYLYAESHFVLDRMSEFLRKELTETDIPIGLLWQRERLETFREIIDCQLETGEELYPYFPSMLDICEEEEKGFLSRRYKVYHNKKILGLITEKFPYTYFRK